MLDPKNMVSLTAGVVADPEIINDRIAKFRIAIDYAGSDKETQSNVGYFDITYYLKDKEGYVSKNASFVHTQITAGKIKKGSQISIIGRLLQERWQQEGKNRSTTIVVAEHIAYAPSGSKPSDSLSSSSNTSSPAPKYASVPEEF